MLPTSQAAASPSALFSPNSHPTLHPPSAIPHLSTTHSLTPSELSSLHATALTAKRTAYCPYSRFRVGASLLTSCGQVFSGANVENAAYPVGICAERVTMGWAVGEMGATKEDEAKEVAGGEIFKEAEEEDGDVMPFERWRRGSGTRKGNGGEIKKGKFKALAVATDGDTPASPCGMCRQFIREFCDLDMPIYMFDRKGNFHVLTLGELLPLSFGPEALRLVG